MLAKETMPAQTENTTRYVDNYRSRKKLVGADKNTEYNLIIIIMVKFCSETFTSKIFTSKIAYFHIIKPTFTRKK